MLTPPPEERTAPPTASDPHNDTPPFEYRPQVLSYRNSAQLTNKQRRQHLQKHSLNRSSNYKACRRYQILNLPSFRIAALDHL